MPPNALINEAEASTIVKYVLALADKDAGTLPLAGTHVPRVPEGDAGNGMLVVRAVYTDQGEEQAPPLTGESVRVLRSPSLNPGRADVKKATESGARGLVARRGAILGFKGVDLTGVRKLEVTALAMATESHAGGTIQVRLDAPDGRVLGEAKVEVREGFGAGRRPGAGAGGGAGRPPGARFQLPAVAVDLAEAPGRHDLYLVFVNEGAKDDARLMNVSAIRLAAAK